MTKREWAEEKALFYQGVTSVVFNGFDVDEVFWINEMRRVEFWLKAYGYGEKDLLSGPGASISEITTLLKFYFDSEEVKHAYSILRESKAECDEEDEKDIEGGRASVALMFFGEFLRAKVPSSKSYLTANSIIFAIESGSKNYTSFDDTRIEQDLQSDEFPYFLHEKE